MINISDQEENEILVLITYMISSDIKDKQSTEKKINDLAENNYEKLIAICHKFITNENEDINIRYYSLILLNILIQKDNGNKYMKISQRIKEEIRNNCLALLGNQSDIIRKYSCIIVSTLGQISRNEKQKEWPELIPILCNGCESNESKFRLSAITTFNMIWEKINNGREAFTNEELCMMESALIKVMASPSNTELALECIKAYQNFINYISNKFNNDNYLKNSLKLILQFCNINEINSIEVGKCAIHCITKITIMAYDYMESFISIIFQLFEKFCVEKNEILAIQSYLFFVSLSEEEIERKKLDDNDNNKENLNNNNKNYIQNNWNLIFNCIKHTIKNYNNNNSDGDEKYTRYNTLYPLIFNISQLCNENIIEEIYQYAFKLMNDPNPLIINSGIYIFTSTLETIHKHKIISNISNIIISLSKYLEINCPELNNTVGNCLEKICEKYGKMIIGDKSLFVQISFLLIKFLTLPQLKNKAKIHLCLCLYNLCEHIKLSNLKHLGLFSPYLNDILTILDNLAYLPSSYDHNSNLAYFSLICISKFLEISTKNDQNSLQNYFQKFYQRFNEAQNIENFNKNEEKQNQFQDLLCLCLNEYCKEGNNNANLEIVHITCFYKIIENYFIIRKATFESGLITLSYLITIFADLKNEGDEEEFSNMIKKTIEYILYTIKEYEDIQSRKSALDCLSKIVHSTGVKIEKYIEKIIKYFENIILSKEANKEILGKILLVYTDLFNYEGKLIWNYLNLSLDCMVKVIDECKRVHEISCKTKLEYTDFRKYIELNDNLIEFIGELLYKIISEKQDLKNFLEKYVIEIIKYLNKIFDNSSFKPLDDYILSSISALMDIIELYPKNSINLLDLNSIENLYQFANNTRDNKIILIKNELQNRIDMMKQSSLNDL